ncbi:hypothetical protein Tco_0797462 [Tanacetum coccineum]
MDGGTEAVIKQMKEHIDNNYYAHRSRRTREEEGQDTLQKRRTAPGAVVPVHGWSSCVDGCGAGVILTDLEE